MCQSETENQTEQSETEDETDTQTSEDAEFHRSVTTKSVYHDFFH